MRGGCVSDATPRPAHSPISSVTHVSLLARRMARLQVQYKPRCLHGVSMKPQPPAPRSPPEQRARPPRKPRVRSTLWDSHASSPVITDKRRHFTRLEMEVVPMLPLDGLNDTEPSTSTAISTTASFRQSYPQPPRTAPADDSSKRYARHYLPPHPGHRSAPAPGGLGCRLPQGRYRTKVSLLWATAPDGVVDVRQLEVNVTMFGLAPVP